MSNPIRIIEIVVQGPQGPQGVPGAGIEILVDPQLGDSDSGVPSQNAVKTYVDSNEPKGFATIAVENQESIAADTEEVTLTVEAGSHISLNTHPNHNKLTISADTQSDNNLTNALVTKINNAPQNAADIKTKLVVDEDSKLTAAEIATGGVELTNISNLTPGHILGRGAAALDGHPTPLDADAVRAIIDVEAGADNTEAAGAVMDSDYQETGSILVGLAPDPDSGVEGGPQKLPKGESGYVLKANETGIGWEPETGGGSVTSVTGGNGITVTTEDTISEVSLSNEVRQEIEINSSKITNANHTGDVTGDQDLTIAQGVVNAGNLSSDVNATIAANTAKVTNATHTGDVTGSGALTIAPHAVDEGKLSEDVVAAIAANTAKITNATHTGDVTGSGALTIADGAVTRDKLNLISSYSNPSLILKGSGDTDGFVQFNDSTNQHTVRIRAPHVLKTANYALTLPDGDGADGEVLMTDGHGNLSWVAKSDEGAVFSVVAGDAITVDNTDPDNPVVGVSDDGITKDKLNLVSDHEGPGLTIQGYESEGALANQHSGSIKLNCSDNSHAVIIKAPPHGDFDVNYTLTLPPGAGQAGQVLKTNGHGVLDWITQTEYVSEVTAGEGITVTDGTGNAVVSVANDGITKNKLNLVTDSQGASLTALGLQSEADGADDYDGAIQLNCSDNSHNVTIKAPPHTGFDANYTLVLPPSDGENNQVLKTDGDGNLGWITQTEYVSEVLGSEAISVTNGTTTPQIDLRMGGVTKDKLLLVSDTTASFTALGAQTADGTSFDGFIQLNSSDNNHGIKLKSPNNDAEADYTLTFPISAGSNGQVLKTDGYGALAWIDPAASFNGGEFETQLRGPVFNADGSFNAGQPVYSFQNNTDTGIFQHSNNSIAFSAAGKFIAKFDLHGLELRTGLDSDGNGSPKSIQFFTDNDQRNITVVPPASIAANYTLTLPATDGDTNQLLRTDGSGNLDWVSPETAAAGDLGLNDKGDLLVGRGSSNAPLPLGIGTDGQVLKADSNQPSGMIWADESGGGGGGSDLTGGGTDKIFLEVENTMDENFATTTQKNYMSVGPLNIQDQIELTITNGSVMTFV